MRPNTAGSEPSGSSVADTKATTNTVLRPNCGRAKKRSRESNQISMVGGSVGAGAAAAAVQQARRSRCVPLQAGLRYQLLYPTLILSFVTIAFYLIGNAFSDAADPKNHLQ